MPLGFGALISSRVCPLLGSLGRLGTVSARVGPCVLLKMLSVCDSVQGTLSSLWQIPFAAPAGGSGKMAILSLWFREAVAYQETIPHPNMPSVEFPLAIYIQGKEFPWRKLLSRSPSPQEGNLQALSTKLASWPAWAGHPPTRVASQPGAERGWAAGTPPSPPADTPRGAERGLLPGKGSSVDLGGSPDLGARTPKHLRLRCAPPPRAPNGSFPQNK